MCRTWMYLFKVLGVLLTQGAVAMEIYTPKELQVVNGTSVRLKCTFTSTHPVSEDTMSVSWNFRQYGQTAEQGFFYYLNKPFPPTMDPLKDHVTWSGDVLNSDASITLNDVQFSFNGTFSCLVRNPPDVHSYASDIVLHVVQSVKLSEIEILAAAVGGAIVLVLLILIIFVTVRYCRRRRRSTDMVLQDTEWKQPSVWALEESETKGPREKRERCRLQQRQDQSEESE